MVQTIAADELADLLGRGDAKGRVDVVDVREIAEYESGHLAQARSIPLETLREDPEKYLTRDTILVFVCKKGVRSVAAAKLAERFGYERIYNLDGGIVEWARVGMPLVTARVAA